MALGKSISFKMSNPIIKVENLSKSYIIGHESRERYTTLRDQMTQKAKSWFSFGTKEKIKHTTEEFWALKDINFEINKGDRVGIIGRNGAGKSTLLKILSRITEPTTGKITIGGRVASLLEVGTGFHPELTGRENIFLNGAILGMSRVEIRKKFDEIVDFAEVEKFLDTPVKRYSSGMYVRLAFAVAAHLEPEILIVDEVLAVGDALFQKKCLGKMEDVSKNEGRTVLFVSHNLSAIRTLCNSGIYLTDGKTIGKEIINTTIHNYNSSVQINTSLKSHLLVGSLILKSIEIKDSPSSLSNVTIKFSLYVENDTVLNSLVMLIYNNIGQRMAILDFRDKIKIKEFLKGQVIYFTNVINKIPIIEGDYSIGFYISTDQKTMNILELARFTVSPKKPETETYIIPYDVSNRGLIELEYKTDITVEYD